jgi:Glycosyl hydrolase family 26
MRGRIALLVALASLALGATGADASGPADWPRLLGVVSDPWHVGSWDEAIGNRFDVQMQFRAFSRGPGIEPALDEATRQGVIPMLTWEPWQPAHGVSPGKVQPAYANAAIAAGALDTYLTTVAQAVAAHPGPVLIRYAHEMNGYWYPWHNDPAAYVAAWRHVVSVFRANRATNAVWIWSVAPNLMLPPGRWQTGFAPYWPGDAWVDVVGITAVRSGRKPFTAAQFGARLQLLRSFGKPVWFTEAGAAAVDQDAFASDLASFVEANSWVRGLVWSQPRSLPAPGSQTARALGGLAAALASER